MTNGGNGGIITAMNEYDFTTMREGRCLEFKQTFPHHADLAKTAVSFANDAGGLLFIGVGDKGQIIGLPEEELPHMEEKINSIIYDRCSPAILPEVSFMTIGGKNIIKVQVYKGSSPPYYIKQAGRDGGTFIRVGSTNRQADYEIIAELDRRRRNVPYDSELVLEKTVDDLHYEGFKQVYLEKTSETLTPQALCKLGLAKEMKNILYPTNALLLLSDDLLRYTLFPYAKIECARFKGTRSEFFIDQKTYDSHILQQAEDAYAFVLRHINKSAHVEGIYTISHWEYPVKAIREVIRNAVVHRQYFFLGKDIKIAIYDDMVEITSPGLVPPTINYDDMESRQSDARNKSIALTFKKLGIIDQWGNGLKLIADELKKYPNIKLRWHNAGLAFQVQFIKTTYQEDTIFEEDVLYVSEPDISEEEPVRTVPAAHSPEEQILALMRANEHVTVPELARLTKLSLRSCERLVATLKQKGLISRAGSARAGVWRVHRGR